MKKKIVLIAEPIEKGIGRHIIDLYNNLKKDDNYEITVLYGTKRIKEQYEEILKKGNNFEIKNFDDKLNFKDIKAFFEIRKILKKIKPDVVHCHGSKSGLEGRIAAKTLRIKKIIYSPHAYFFLKFDSKSFKRKLFILAEKFLSKFCTNITVTTSKGEDLVFVENKIDKESKRVLIEHGIEVEKIDEFQVKEERKKYNVSDNDVFIGTMARFEEQKDPLGTIEIMKKIINEINGVKCIFWGNGKLFELAKSQVGDNNKNIILAGETSNPDVSLKSLDIYLTASLYEGLPYTLLESLALGRAVVASNVEGNKDCVYDGKNGYLFTARNYDEAAKNLKTIIENNEMKRMGDESFNIYQTRFSVSKMVEKYNKLYLE